MKTYKISSQKQLSHFIENEIENDDIVVDLLEYKEAKIEDMEKLAHCCEKHKDIFKRSFVVVSSAFDYDQIPQTLSFAPTVEEAKDIIEMDILEREL